MRKQSHHFGPFPKGYIQDIKKRGVSFCKRSKTLLKLVSNFLTLIVNGCVKCVYFQAKEIHMITGAKVDLSILNVDTNNIKEFHSQPLTKRTVMLQTGTSFVKNRFATREQRSDPIGHTPTKKRKVLKELTVSKSIPSHQLIKNLPTKKKIQKKLPSNRATNKCKKCNVIYESKKYKQLKRKFKIQNTWIACDYPHCSYWGHARCFDVTISRKYVSAIPFLCPFHLENQPSCSANTTELC